MAGAVELVVLKSVLANRVFEVKRGGVDLGGQTYDRGNNSATD